MAWRRMSRQVSRTTAATPRVDHRNGICSGRGFSREVKALCPPDVLPTGPRERVVSGPPWLAQRCVAFAAGYEGPPGASVHLPFHVAEQVFSDPYGLSEVTATTSSHGRV